MATYNLANSSTTSVSGTLQIGVSADSGLTTTGVTFANGSTGNFQTTSKMSCSGNFVVDNSDIWTTFNTLTYTQTGSGNMSNPDGQNQFYSFTQDAGTTITCTGGCRITDRSSMLYTQNGTINVNGNTIYIGADINTGSLTFGANSDFTGAGTVAFRSTYGTNYTYSKTGAFSFTGSLFFRGKSATNSAAFTGDWSNCSKLELVSDQSSGNWTMMKCGAYTLDQGSDVLTVDNATHDPDFEVSGTIDFDDDTGTITYNKGSGTIKLTGTNQSIDFFGLDVEPVWSSANIGNVTVLAADTWDISTLDLTVGAFTVNGKIVMGSTASTGLTIGTSITFGAASEADLQQDSKIINNGSYSCEQNNIWTNNARGDYTHNATSNYANRYSANIWYAFTLNATKTLTTNSAVSYLSSELTNSCTINGTINSAVGNRAALGISAAGTMIFGSNANITGTDSLEFRSLNGTFTNNRASAFTYSGTVICANSVVDNLVIPTWDFSNADVTVQGPSGAGGRTRSFAIGTVSSTLKCVNLTYEDNGQTFIIDNSGDNPNFEITGNFLIDDAGGAVTFTAGTGTLTMTNSAGTQTITTAGETIEALVINGAGATKQFQDAGGAVSFTLTAGTVDHNTQDFSTTGNYVISAGGLNNDVGLNGMTLTVGGNYNVCGVAGTLLDLGAGAGWTLTITGTGRACHVTVKNSNAGGGSPVLATNSTDEGSNTNWSFASPGVGNYYNPGIKVNKKTQVLIV
jgi:hypothetical protein